MTMETTLSWIVDDMNIKNECPPKKYNNQSCDKRNCAECRKQNTQKWLDEKIKSINHNN